MKKGLLAWHFLPADGKLRHDDGRTPKDGERITVIGGLSLCAHGLHASVDPLHALSYAPGLMLCQVRLSGEIIKDIDKVVSSERTILWRADATKTVVRFARWCADRAKRHAARDAAYAAAAADAAAAYADAAYAAAALAAAAYAAALAAARDAARDAAAAADAAALAAVYTARDDAAALAAYAARDAAAAADAAALAAVYTARDDAAALAAYAARDAAAAADAAALAADAAAAERKLQSQWLTREFMKLHTK